MALGFLIDENVPMDVVRFIGEQGRKTRQVREALRRGAKDNEVIAAALAEDEIVVTWNVKHFNKARAHVLGFKCPEPVGTSRLRALWEVVELEARLADEKKHRFLMLLNETMLTIRR